MFSYITGLINQTFKIGLDGPILKDNVGTLQASNNNGFSYSNVLVGENNLSEVSSVEQSRINLKFGHLYIQNNTGSSIAALKVVKLVGDDSSDAIPRIAQFTSNLDTPLGVTIAVLPTATLGYILRFGRLANCMDTSTATIGDAVYAESSGDLTLSSVGPKIGIVESVSLNGTVLVTIGQNIHQVSEGLKLTNGTLTLDIHDLYQTSYLTSLDEFAIYSNSDPYDPYTIPDTRKVTFQDLESNITLGNLSGKLPIAKGGTNSSTPLNNNRFIISTGGIITEQLAISPGFVIVSDPSGLPEAAQISIAQLNSLSGISGNIQSQFSGKASTGANTDINSIFLNNRGLKVQETSGQFGLTIQPGSDLSADRTLAIITGDSNRSLTLNSDVILSGTNTGDQTANDGVKLQGSTFSLDIHGLNIVTFISGNDEIPIYSTADPYLTTDNRKVTFSDLQSQMLLSSIGGKLSVEKGGTNSSTSLNNNRIIISVNGEITEASAIPASRVIITNGSGLPVASLITETQIDSLSGISGNIQSQFSGKANIGANLDINSIFLDNQGLKIRETTGQFGLIVQPGSDLSADRTLSIITGDSNRILSLTGNSVLSGTNTGDNTASDGVKLVGSDIRLDIHGLSIVTFISGNDEIALYSTADPYLTTDNRKVTFNDLQSQMSLNLVGGKLSVEKGGTNSSTTLNNNRFIISVNGEITEQSAITAHRVILSDAAGLPQASAISETELDALSGVTGNVQTQLNSKLQTASDGVKAVGTDVRLDIHGLTPTSYIFANDEFAFYSEADPYLATDNRKVNFSTLESHLTLNNLVGPLSIAKGGTNSTTPLNNNRFIISVGGEITEASAMTAGRVLLTDSNGLPEASAITENQLDSLSGISGNIQVLLNGKISTSLGNSHIIVGNSSNIAAEVALSGDATIANTGALTVSASTVLDHLGNTQGDILYRSASAWTVLAPGTNGQVLTTGGANANPSWTTSSGSGSGVSAWTTSTSYSSTTPSFVTAEGNIYVCITSNTSGSTFAADFALGYWRLVNVPKVGKNYIGYGDNFEDTLSQGWTVAHTSLSSLLPTSVASAGTAFSSSQGGSAATNLALQAFPTFSNTFANTSATNGSNLINFSTPGVTGIKIGMSISNATSGFPSSAFIIGISGTNVYINANYTGTTGSIGTSTVSATALQFQNSIALVTNSTAGTFPGSTAGDLMISQAYTIDIADQAKVLSFKFSYKNISGAALTFAGTSSNSLAVYLYDVTNAAWIQPAGVYNLVQSSGVGICQGTFQTPSNMTQFQIAIINVNATGSNTPYDIYFDDFYAGPQALAFGPPISDSDYISTSVTLSAVTTAPTFGTTTTNQLLIRRVGDRLEGYGTVVQTAAGTAGSGNYYLTMPSGYSIDTNKISLISNSSTLPKGSVGRLEINVSNTLYTGSIYVQSSSNMMVVFDGANGTNSFWSSTTANINGSASATLSFFFSVPISGYSSNTVMSADTDTRIVQAFAYALAATQSVGSAAAVNFDTVVTDTHGAITTGGSGAWKFTAPIAGKYIVHAIVNDGTGNNLRLYKNGSLTNAGYFFKGGTTGLAGATVEIDLIAGDFISANCGGSTTINGGTSGNGSTISINRLTGPAVVAASESVNASYYVSTNYTISANQAINFDTKLDDSHNAVTTGASNAWKFTAPVSGKYRVSFSVEQTAATGTIFLYKNGSSFKAIQAIDVTNTPFPGGTDIRLVAGDTISINGNAGITFVGSGTPYVTYIDIARIGN